jgi:mRNA interferase MazF
MQRGDVYQALLSPTEGSEQAGVRPVIIVSRNAINEFSSVVVVVPVTGLEHKMHHYPSQVEIKAGEGGMTKDSVALGEQVRAISKKRLRKSMGQLHAPTMAALNTALKITLDLP